MATCTAGASLIFDVSPSVYLTTTLLFHSSVMIPPARQVKEGLITPLI